MKVLAAHRYIVVSTNTFPVANDRNISSDYEKKSTENPAPHLVRFVLENPLGKCSLWRMNKFDSLGLGEEKLCDKSFSEKRC